MERKLLILKGVLLLRKFNRYQTKEEQIEECEKYYSDEILKEWIESLKEDLAKTPEQREAEAEELLERFSDFDAEQDRKEMESFPCCSNRDYGPSNPWDAPGMSIHDFI